jgi:hypothetical protein
MTTKEQLGPVIGKIGSENAREVGRSWWPSTVAEDVDAV